MGATERLYGEDHGGRHGGPAEPYAGAGLRSIGPVLPFEVRVEIHGPEQLGAEGVFILATAKVTPELILGLKDRIVVKAAEVDGVVGRFGEPAGFGIENSGAVETG